MLAPNEARKNDYQSIWREERQSSRYAYRRSRRKNGLHVRLKSREDEDVETVCELFNKRVQAGDSVNGDFNLFHDGISEGKDLPQGIVPITRIRVGMRGQRNHERRTVPEETSWTGHYRHRRARHAFCRHHPFPC